MKGFSNMAKFGAKVTGLGAGWVGHKVATRGYTMKGKK